MLFVVALSALSLVSLASAQQVVTVEVGGKPGTPALQFTPSSFTAAKGTVVNFKFTGTPGNHTITQSSFASPCDPLPGGFDSGSVFIPPTPALSAVPEFNLTITDDSKPIWFYCKQLNPVAHCSGGMVGAINAPTTGNTFTAFQSAAEKATSVGQAQGGLVGVGASASAGIGPVPSGATVYTGAAAAATASGSGTKAAPAGSTSTPKPASNGALGLGASSLFSLTAAAVGLMLV